jgi:High-affinity nickel-transport protein
MTTLLSILLLGFFLGMRHATDADHVIAITTIVSRQRNVGGAALTGIFWGIGHTVTLFIVGGAIILFGLIIPERIGLSFEFCVALMLIFLGVLNLRVIKQGRHDHDEIGGPPVRLELRPIVIGVVHGLAGSAAIALLVLPIIRDPVWALAYLLIFGIGTIAGMMLITAAIAAPITYSANRFQFLNRYVGATAGMMSVAFGLFLVYQIGFVNGLFTR